MKLVMQVGLGPGHIVLDGDPAPTPPKGGGDPQFSAHICCGQMARRIKIPLGMEEGLGPGNFVLDGDPDRLPQKRGGAPSPIFGPCPLWPNGWMDQDGTWHRGVPWSRLHCARLGPSSRPQKGGGAPPPQFFGTFPLWPNGWMHQDATRYMEVGLNLGEFMLDGDPALHKKGRSPLELRLRISKLDRKRGHFRL